MKKIILALAITAVTLPAFANKPVARAAVVASSDHPAEMAIATGHNGNHPVARTAVVATSDHPLAAAAVTSHH